jgi:hypothetical protein
MKSKAATFALLGLLVGILIAEFDPELFARGFRQFGASLSDPFDNYRNHLAGRYGLAGGVIGLIAGLLLDSGKKS